jgi:hypothetical protein
MTAHYAAFGLELRASFSLPGMASEQACELPWLELDLTTPEELEAAWSGAEGPPAWRGRLGDGLELAMQRGIAGDLLFSYCEHARGHGVRARYRLRADMRRLDCAPAQPEDLDWQRALIGKVLPIVSVMRGYEALHAAVVDTPEGVLAIMAPSGTGKSTLAIELVRRGRPLFADDVLILERSEGAGTDGVRIESAGTDSAGTDGAETHGAGIESVGTDGAGTHGAGIESVGTDGAGTHGAGIESVGIETVRAHPGAPHMNLAEDLPSAIDPHSLGSTLGILAGERWLTAHTTARGPRPVGMLCLLERAAGLPLATEALPRNPLALAPYMLGLSTDAERQRRRFELYANLIESAALVRLTAGLEHRPEQLGDMVEQALTHRPELAGALA